MRTFIETKQKFKQMNTTQKACLIRLIKKNQTFYKTNQEENRKINVRKNGQINRY